MTEDEDKARLKYASEKIEKLTAWGVELEAQMKMLREKLSFYEAKIRRLECEVRLKEATVKTQQETIQILHTQLGNLSADDPV